MAKLPAFDLRLQRSDAQPPEYSLEFSVRDGGVGLLRAARPGGSPATDAAAAGDARRLSEAQLRGSRFEVLWEQGVRRIAYGLFSLEGPELDHLVPGTWYSLRPERRDGPRRLELARPGGSFGLARVDPGEVLAEDPDTEDRPQEIAGAVELSPSAVIDPTPGAPRGAGQTAGGRLVGPTSGALVRHLRRKQARDAREIARLRTELKRLHGLLKGAGVSVL